MCYNESDQTVISYWKPLVVNGNPIDLSHLEPFNFERAHIHITLENGSDYAIFFHVKKQAVRLCSLFVMSAYPMNKPRAKVDLSRRMKFKTAVAKIATGRKPKFPLQRH